ncbi:MAG: CTP synthase [Thermoproteota archaeon]|jgi:CTP synthase|nr:CTP synthase [Thermoproteota archaeon]
MTKYIFITGGVLSSVGKGIITSSIGKILQVRGYRVTAIKIDPYLNMDSGSMNPYMHGEVFVTEDGAETDMDIGHYERFLDINLTREHNITTGQIYETVITKERRGDYLGQCVQIIPHITDEIKRRIKQCSYKSGAEIAIVEIGGTVGDIEGLPFLEAARQMKLEEPIFNVAFVHVALVPTLKATGEQKTKPLQHSVNELRRIGIQPDIIVARSEKPITQEAKRKIALFGNVKEEFVFNSFELENIYELPLVLERQGMSEALLRLLALERRDPDWNEWNNILNLASNAKHNLKIAMVGKYSKLADAYVSINEALKHAGFHLRSKVEYLFIEAENIERNENEALNSLLEADGIIILPGFGARGSEGKIKAAEIARTNKIPLLGICFGFQLSIVEFARNVCKLENANSTEIDPYTPHPVIDLLPEQRNITMKGGTMRLGAYEIEIKENTLAYRIYEQKIVYERHRHRYELNPKYIDILSKHGMIFSGFSKDGRAEFAEINGQFYFLTQAHPEFKSRPNRPSRPYYHFLKAALEYKYETKRK